MMQTQRRDGFIKKLIRKTSSLRKHHHKATDSTITLHFQLRKFTEDFPGEEILICGSIPELGSGNMENSPTMTSIDTAEGRLWKFDVVVPLNELEHSRRDIAGSYEGNPHGLFFTYNYAVKQPSHDGMPAMEKFEPISRRGIPRSSLISSVDDKTGTDNFLHELSLQHVWGQPDVPLTDSVIPKKLDTLFIGAPNKDMQLKPADSDPLKSAQDENRLRGKAPSASSSPSMSARASNNDSVLRAPQALDAPRPIMDRSVSFIDRKQDRQVHFSDMSSAGPADTLSKPRGMFKWYKNYKDSKPESSRKISGIDRPAIKGNERIVSDYNFSNMMSPSDGKTKGVQELLPISNGPSKSILDEPTLVSSIARALSPEIIATTSFHGYLPGSPKKRTLDEMRTTEDELSEKRRREEEQKIINHQFNLRRSCDNLRTSTNNLRTETPAESVQVQLAKPLPQVPLPEMSAIQEEEFKEPLPELPTMEEREELEHDPLMNAVTSSMSSEIVSLPHSSIEELENKAIANLRLSSQNVFGHSPTFSVCKAEEIPQVLDTTSSMVPPLSNLSYDESTELSEEVLLDCIEENTPLLAPESEQLQDVVSDLHVHEKKIHIEQDIAETSRRLSITRSPTMDFSDFFKKAALETRSISADSVDPLLFGKYHRVNQEIHEKVGENYYEFLSSKKNRSAASRLSKPVDPVISGRLHRVHQDLIKKIGGERSYVDFLGYRRRSVDFVDPILSGKWHRVHHELVRKLGDTSSVDFLKSRNARIVKFESVNPIISGKWHRVHLELNRKLVDVSSVDFLKLRNARQVRPAGSVDPILSGKWHRIHKELIQEIGGRNSWTHWLRSLKVEASDISRDIYAAAGQAIDASSPITDPALLVSSAIEVPLVIESRMPVVESVLPVTDDLLELNRESQVIVTEEVKTMNVFEEQIEKELTHRRTHLHDAAPKIESSPIKPASIRSVGYHAVRDDFMPIVHSSSKIADPLPVIEEKPKREYMAAFALFFTVVVWLFLYSIYFPESILMEMSPSTYASTDVIALEQNVDGADLLN